MSVIDINERWQGRRGQRASGGSSYDRVLIVRTDTVNDGPEEVIEMVEDAGYTVGSGYPSNTAAKLQTIDPTSKGRQVWYVELAYETPTGNPTTEDPTDQDPVIKWSFAQYNNVLSRAYDTRPSDGVWGGGPYVQGTPAVDITNSATKKFSPEPTQQESNLLCDITVWRNSFDPADARAFINTLNDDAITIAGLPVLTWEARMRNYGSTKKYKSNGNAYYEINWQIEIEVSTWVRAFLDQGFYRLDDGDPVLILDSKQQKLKKPALLDGLGEVLGEEYDPVFIEFLTYYPADWSTINLPATG